jgi:Domain of Unknown Function (DUF1540)
MDMPKIMDCTMEDCAYNRNEECHAMAITVGDHTPICDTYICGTHKSGVKKRGCVGACKVEECKFNDELECCSSGIHVGIHSNQPECLTFDSKH